MSLFCTTRVCLVVIVVVCSFFFGVVQLAILFGICTGDAEDVLGIFGVHTGSTEPSQYCARSAGDVLVILEMYSTFLGFILVVLS